MSKFSSSDYKKNDVYSVFKFKYYYDKDNIDDEYVVFCDEDLERYKSIKWSEGLVLIRIPTWIEMHDIYRISTITDARTLEKTIDPEKFKDAKLKKLCIKFIDHEGLESISDNDYIDDLNPRLANMILFEIDRLIEENCDGDGLSKKEAKELSLECYRFYSSQNKRQMGSDTVEMASPPAIIILKQVCEMFNCTPDQARKISKRDIDMAFIAQEQQNICRDPHYIGMNNRYEKNGMVAKG